MSDQNIPAANTEQPAACSKGCQHRGGGILRAAMYTPVVLILGALGALATFPELAEYATPLIGEADCNTCPISAALARARQSCSVSQGCGSSKGCSSSQSSSQEDAMGCCPTSSETSLFVATSKLKAGRHHRKRNGCTASTAVVEEPTAEATEAVEPAASADEAPADAISAANVVDIETPSN